MTDHDAAAARPWLNAAPCRRARRSAPGRDDARGEGRALLPVDDHDRATTVGSPARTPCSGSQFTEEAVVGRHMTHFNLFGETPSGRWIARWQNELGSGWRHPRAWASW